MLNFDLSSVIFCSYIGFHWNLGRIIEIVGRVVFSSSNLVIIVFLLKDFILNCK